MRKRHFWAAAEATVWNQLASYGQDMGIDVASPGRLFGEIWSELPETLPPVVSLASSKGEHLRLR
ncbi:hypothetical protein [Methylocucumis oryzae]|uniref:hypothetical protein n=1 Tax=Methylocucumis oryzae TaxID=1632867 RepID=UPI0010405A29|nr:hypothetical protein [Methylocucumis oryzae]